VLLEVDEAGARLVATDGRRMVVIELDRQEGPFRGQAILPRGIALLVGKLIDRKSDDAIAVFVKPNSGAKGKHKPAHLSIAGPDWLLSGEEPEGDFISYRELIPKSHSRFIVDRARLIDTISEVAISANGEFNAVRAVRFDLMTESVKISAGLTWTGESSGTVVAEFAGGGDDHIIAAFAPTFLLDALKSLPDERVVIDVGQNRRSPDGDRVLDRPAIIQGLESTRIRWTVMPMNVNLPVSPETLGSNYDDSN
jgi:DNA polymerase III sliding clamp (beta) subunit (PCNA family)